jgi:predicted class III extradiol MEMO1 family dioxygenase
MAKCLAVADPQNLFVISSDFCHWGSRFRYNYYDKSAGPIWKSIENLDKTVSRDKQFLKISPLADDDDATEKAHVAWR